MVLGCGSAAQTGSESDDHQSAYRAAVVAMRTSCRCYDDQPITCYAVCGLFTVDANYPGSFAAARLLVPTVRDSAGLRSSSPTKPIVLAALLGLLLDYYGQN